MTYFLTSSPCMPDSPSLNPANGFVEELRRALPGPCSALFIASDPDEPEHTYRFFNDMPPSFAEIGLPFTRAEALIRGNQDRCGELLAGTNLIFLCGGHVPTQNRFFRQLRLRERLRGWDGVVIGVSAGSMNAADVVYVQPEEPGEALDPQFQRFAQGLGLTGTMMLPHYQRAKDNWLDGLRLYEDITYGDSMGRRFYALPDGSYILGRDSREELRGEGYLICNGEIRKISAGGECVEL